MEAIGTLITEIREDFQLPPYVSDSVLKRLVSESEAYFQSLVDTADWQGDNVYRELLKNRVYYAFNHALNDFRDNYRESILSWQITREIDTEEEDDEA